MNALSELRRLTYEDSAGDHVLVAAAERDFQVAIQAALDIGSSILAEQQVGPPQRYGDIFPALAEIGVLPEDFAERLTNMARFRNVLVHLYVEVDTGLVYRYLQENLDDFVSFCRFVSSWMRASGG